MSSSITRAAATVSLFAALQACSGLFGIDFDTRSEGSGGTGGKPTVNAGGSGGAGAQGGGGAGGDGPGSCQRVEAAIPVSGIGLFIRAIERVEDRRFFVVGRTGLGDTTVTTMPGGPTTLQGQRPFVLDVEVDETGAPVSMRAASFGGTDAIPSDTTVVGGELHVVGASLSQSDGRYWNLGADPTAGGSIVGVAIRSSEDGDPNPVDLVNAVSDRGDGVLAVAGSCGGPTVDEPTGQLSVPGLPADKSWACPIIPNGPPAVGSAPRFQ
jgi:hypothetical protein